MLSSDRSEAYIFNRLAKLEKVDPCADARDVVHHRLWCTRCSSAVAVSFPINALLHGAAPI
jgi:hypothetical protein